MRNEIAKIVREFGFESSDPVFSLPDLIEFSLKSYRTLDDIEEKHLRAVVYAVCLLEVYKEKRKFDRKWARFLARAGNPNPLSYQDVCTGGRKSEAKTAYKYIANKRLVEALLRDQAIMDDISENIQKIHRILSDQKTRDIFLNPS